MTRPATVSLVIATPSGMRHLASPTERGVAEPAEAILRGLGTAVCGASFWVECQDAGVRARLTAYLWDVKAEVLAEAAQGAA